eukprot:COSAG01_NODE_713_length_14097_cov_15.136448_8_plen_187_part_00
MNNYSLIYTYLEALDFSVTEKKKLEVFNMLESVLNGVIKCAEFDSFFSGQRVTLKEKTDLFQSFLKHLNINELERFFVLFLSEDRFYLFPQLLKLVVTYKVRFQIEAEALLESPVDLSSETLLQLQEVFELKIKQKIKFNLRLNPDLLGGVKVTIGHKVYDASLSNSLEQFSSSLSDLNFMIGEKV